MVCGDDDLVPFEPLDVVYALLIGVCEVRAGRVHDPRIIRPGGHEGGVEPLHIRVVEHHPEELVDQVRPVRDLHGADGMCTVVLRDVEPGAVHQCLGTSPYRVEGCHTVAPVGRIVDDEGIVRVVGRYHVGHIIVPGENHRTVIRVVAPHGHERTCRLRLQDRGHNDAHLHVEDLQFLHRQAGGLRHALPDLLHALWLKIRPHSRIFAHLRDGVAPVGEGGVYECIIGSEFVLHQRPILPAHLPVGTGEDDDGVCPRLIACAVLKCSHLRKPAPRCGRSHAADGEREGRSRDNKQECDEKREFFHTGMCASERLKRNVFISS
ncbi:hypothetical protein DSECCO2_622940 [anaerobic digester metagenome]